MVQGTGQLIDLGFPQYCSLTILCQLSDRATFIFLRTHGYNSEIENILQKRSTFGDGTWSGLLAVPALVLRFYNLSTQKINLTSSHLCVRRLSCQSWGMSLGSRAAS